MSTGFIGQRGFRLGIGYSLDHVGIKIEASAHGWGVGASDIKIALSGALTAEEAMAFGEQLIAKARAVAERKAKYDAAEKRRQVWRARQPTTYLR